jgi:hypothetical protein
VTPIVIDLFCGRFGWSKGFLAHGFHAIGFDLEQMGPIPEGAELVRQDVLTLHGSQFKHATAIVASPPCQAYSYMAMPWDRSKREIRWQEWERDSPFGNFTLNNLFNACFRIQREASEAARHHIPMVVENVCGAQKWVGRAAWHFGSYYLWGDVPALMPFTKRFKNSGGSWFAVAHNTTSGTGNNPVSVPEGFNGADHETRGVKVPGINLSDVGFNVAAAQRYREAQGVKTVGHANIRDGFDHTRHLTNQRESEGLKGPGGDWFKDGRQGQDACAEGIKQHGSGPEWFDKALDERRKEAGQKCKGDWFNGYKPGQCQANNFSSRGDSRKAASALIAEIPFTLAEWIARCFKPSA